MNKNIEFGESCKILGLHGRINFGTVAHNIFGLHITIRAPQILRWLLDF
jgi:hypothetical protein